MAVSDDKGGEKRAHPRVVTDLKVRSRLMRPSEVKGIIGQLGDTEPNIPRIGSIKAEGGAFELAAYNISEGGLSTGGDLEVVDDKVPPRGRDLVLEFDINDSGLPVKAVGVVAWSRPDEGKRFRAGLMFTIISEKNLERIRDYVGRHEAA